MDHAPCDALLGDPLKEGDGLAARVMSVHTTGVDVSLDARVLDLIQHDQARSVGYAVEAQVAESDPRTRRLVLRITPLAAHVQAARKPPQSELIGPEKTISVPEAGRRFFDLGRNASYQAAKRGEIPCVKIGGRLRAVVAALEKKLADTK